MKWNHNGIKYERGCYLVLVAQFDGEGNWWEVGSCCSQQSMRSQFKRLGEYFGAKKCEVKRLYDDNDNPVEKSVPFRFGYDGTLYVGDDKMQKYSPFTSLKQRGDSDMSISFIDRKLRDVELQAGDEFISTNKDGVCIRYQYLGIMYDDCGFDYYLRNVDDGSFSNVELEWFRQRVIDKQ